MSKIITNKFHLIKETKGWKEREKILKQFPQTLQNIRSIYIETSYNNYKQK